MWVFGTVKHLETFASRWNDFWLSKHTQEVNIKHVIDDCEFLIDCMIVRLEVTGGKKLSRQPIGREKSSFAS